MKRWLMIFVLMLTAAMALAESSDHVSSETAPLPTAVFTQADSDVPAADTTPLLAIPTGTPMHFCGTGHTPVKGNRHTHENPAFGQYSHTTDAFAAISKITKVTSSVHPAYARTADRYIYFLRRIII